MKHLRMIVPLLAGLLPATHGLHAVGATAAQAPSQSALSTISIHNTTNETLYGALYYKHKNGATKWGPSHEMYALAPQVSSFMGYPPKKAGGEIALCIAHQGEQLLLLSPELTASELTAVHVHTFGNLYAYEWYFTGHFDILFDISAPHQLRTTAVGGGILPRISKLSKGAQEREKELLSHFEAQHRIRAPHYAPDPAIHQAQGKYSLITQPEDLTLERHFIDNRSQHVRAAINELFGYEIVPHGVQPPTIAIAFTGGGYRSKIETNGILAGAADAAGGNFYDCLSYLMGCSGSSWAISTLVASGLNPCDHCRAQREKVGRGGLSTLISDLVNKSPSYLERRFIETRHGHYHGPIGVYGHAIGRALLDNITIGEKTAHHITFSDVRERLADAKHPLPICVAIDPGTTTTTRVWYEFSPFYCGTHQGRCWIDAKLQGCTFKNGAPVHMRHEDPLADRMGIWGSAFAVTPEDIAKESKVMSWLAQILPGVGLGLTNAYRFMLWGEPMEDYSTHRAAVKAMPNFWYGAEALPKRLSEPHKLYLVDGAIAMEGGYRHNFATVPALWRGVDILIMCDNPHDPKTDTQSKHLLAAELEARRLGLPFPSISTSEQHKSTLKTMHNDVCSVFIEEGAPIVIYIKAKRNTAYDASLKANSKDPKLRAAGFDPDETVAGFTTTSNFHYTPAQYDLLAGLTRSIFIQCKPAIKSAIRTAIERRNSAKRKWDY